MLKELNQAHFMHRVSVPQFYLKVKIMTYKNLRVNDLVNLLFMAKKNRRCHSNALFGDLSQKYKRGAFPV